MSFAAGVSGQVEGSAVRIYSCGAPRNRGCSCQRFCLQSLRAAIVRAVLSGMPLSSTPAILSLPDGPVGAVPALDVVRSRFKTMRRHLACRRACAGVPGDGPAHLLLDSAVGFKVCLGFS